MWKCDKFLYMGVVVCFNYVLSLFGLYLKEWGRIFVYVMNYKYLCIFFS